MPGISDWPWRTRRDEEQPPPVSINLRLVVNHFYCITVLSARGPLAAEFIPSRAAAARGVLNLHNNVFRKERREMLDGLFWSIVNYAFWQNGSFIYAAEKYSIYFAEVCCAEFMSAAWCLC